MGGKHNYSLLSARHKNRPRAWSILSLKVGKTNARILFIDIIRLSAYKKHGTA